MNAVVTAPDFHRRAAIIGGRIAVAALMLGSWSVLAAEAGPLYLVGPAAVVERIVQSSLSGELPLHVLETLRLAAGGFSMGFGIGAAVPLSLSATPRLTGALGPFVVASAGVPKYALMPLFILWFGIDDAPKLLLVGLLVFYPTAFAVHAGIRNVNRKLIDVVRVFGAGHGTVVRAVIWPSMHSFVFAALRIAVPRAVSAAVIGELLVGQAGLGYAIESARQNLDIAGVLAGVTVATALVVAAATTVREIESRTLVRYGRAR